MRHVNLQPGTINERGRQLTLSLKSDLVLDVVCSSHLGTHLEKNHFKLMKDILGRGR